MSITDKIVGVLATLAALLCVVALLFVLFVPEPWAIAVIGACCATATLLTFLLGVVVLWHVLSS